jgi:hypothetical protein
MPNNQPLPLFYKEVVPLKTPEHQAWALDSEQNYSFANQTNLIHLTLAEFDVACKSYPIVFAELAGEVVTLAVVGLTEKQNLFVSMDGQWADNYIPAYVRRYPFVLATADAGQNYTVCIDSSVPSALEAESQRLFLDDGGQSPFLQEKVAFLQEYENQTQATKQFSKVLKSLDILEPMQAQVSPKNLPDFSLSGFLVVNEKKLSELAPEKLSELAKNGYLGRIYAHLVSMGNFHCLLDRYVAGNP